MDAPTDPSQSSSNPERPGSWGMGTSPSVRRIVSDHRSDPVTPEDLQSAIGPVSLVVGNRPSLDEEVHSLRRQRLASAACVLSIAYALVFVWNLYSAFDGRSERYSLIPILFGVRFGLVFSLAAFLLSPIRLSALGLRAVEISLFGGLTVLLGIAQYQVNLHYLRGDELARFIAFEKNGVVQIILLMMIYGVFIPNKPRQTGLVLLAIAAVPPILVVLLLREMRGTAMLAKIEQAESLGSSLIYCTVGAILAFYSARLLNGFRTELHKARRFGQYRLGRKLGEGGMGEVYLAEHRLLKRPCALKTVRPNRLDDHVSLSRFEREVRSAASLMHPNTIEIYDYGRTADGQFYYVMEYLRGMDLTELVTRFGPMSPARVIYLIRQVCSGLNEAHEQGMIHRDIKPSNIYVACRGGECDVAKVLDFGLVRQVAETPDEKLTAERRVSGTPAFMAPEQAMGLANLDARVDIYALGCVAYYMLTGVPPFVRETRVEIMFAQARDPVVPPSHHRPELHADIEDVVLRCLEKAPADRFQTARALSRALGNCTAAAEWDGEDAERWWALNAPSVFHPLAEDEIDSSVVESARRS